VPSENLEVAKRGSEAFRDEGVEGLLEFAHPEIEMITPVGLAVEPDTYVGHDGIRRYFDSFYEMMDEIRIEPREYHEVGDKVLIETTLRARGKATGIEVEQTATQLWEFEDGLARRATFYATLEEARAAAED
jgi:ketosteroid isomerase-like protein